MSSLEPISSQPLNREEFIYLEMGFAGTSAGGKEFFSRNHFGTKDSIRAMREKQNNTGLYRSAFMYDNMDPYNSNLFGDFFMDFDSEEDLELARQDLLFVIWRLNLKTGFNLPMDAFRIYFSGKKGFHLTIPWQYFNIEPHAQLDRIFRWIAEDLHRTSMNQTIDLVIYEKRRLYRMENTIHQRTGLYKIPLQYDEAAHASMEEIQQLALKNRYIRYQEPVLVPEAAKRYRKYVEDYNTYINERKAYIGTKDFLPLQNIPDYVQKLIEEGPVQGQRNETAAALTSFWRRQGCEQEQIWEQLVQWNAGSLSENELRTTMDSILKRDLHYSLSRLKALSEGDTGETLYTKDRYMKGRGRV